jgi:trans-aconitate methyltransferase
MDLIRDWDAGTYHRVSDPQFRWGMRVLDRLDLRGDERVADVGCGTGRLTRELGARVPRGWVVAVDRSASMLAQAKSNLVDLRIPVVQADAAALPFFNTWDVIFSTATFHWVLDHDALFRSLLGALRAGGRLHAQCGGGPNLARLRARAADLMRREPFLEHFRTGWREPWHYADSAEAGARMAAAGFRDVAVSLEAAPVAFPSAAEFRAFVDNVCLHPYLSRLPAGPRRAFSEHIVEAAGSDDPPFVLDYWRLNLSGRKGEPKS